MSLNVSGSKYVTVSDVTMKFAYSEKVLFADLRTSRKTGNPKTDNAGKVITDEQGNPIMQRIYTHWNGKFVGNALEPAKALVNGQAIDIINGWIEKEEAIGKNGQKYTNICVTISDFVLSDSQNIEEEENPFIKDVEKQIDEVENSLRALNGDENTPVGGGRE